MNEPSGHLALDQLVAAVRAGRRHRAVCEDVVRQIGRRELARRRSLKEAVKATRNKLHQVGGAYLHAGMRYPAWQAELAAAAQKGRERLRAVCRAVMAHHASTRERLPILEEFHATLFAGLPPVRSVLDVACGLHPLAIPWMPLAEGALYHACDIYGDLVDFLQGWLDLLGVQGRAWACDATTWRPAGQTDVALALKAIPCLEQIDPGAGARLLAALPARCLIVSFPVASLGGRRRGMARYYEERFRRLTAGREGPIERFEFATELVFRVTRTGAA